MEKKLDLILSELQNLNQRVGSIENEIVTVKSQMNSRFDTLETRMANMDTKMSDMDTKMDFMQQDITEIKYSVNRIEENEPADILAMLDQINKKLDDEASSTSVLNKRLFKVESVVEQLTNQ